MRAPTIFDICGGSGARFTSSGFVVCPGCSGCMLPCYREPERPRAWFPIRVLAFAVGFAFGMLPWIVVACALLACSVTPDQVAWFFGGVFLCHQVNRLSS